MGGLRMLVSDMKEVVWDLVVVLVEMRGRDRRYMGDVSIRRTPVNTLIVGYACIL